MRCCVIGCKNSYSNTNRKDVTFYNFPNKWHEAQRKIIWIQTLNRGCLWQPKVHDKVCSKHFVGNKKSNNPLSLSYNPTIFPKKYHKELPLMHQITPNKFMEETENIGNPRKNSQVEELRTKNFECQVNFEDEPLQTTTPFIFECDFTGALTEVKVQVFIPKSHTNNFRSYQDQCSGNDEEIICSGFHGYASVKSEQELSSLCGVTFATFSLLVSYFITPNTPHGNCKLNEKNYLLLFLMKLKLGISFTALGVLFNLHHTNISRQFIKILCALRVKLTNFVYWPRRSVIDLTMPKTFQINFPKCRAIIDCSEIKIEQPSNVDARIYTYSHYKGTYTAKFLIAVAPNGFITFVSKCYGGRSSDSFITNDSGFLNLLEADDLILADKGFPGIKCEKNAIVVVPPFVHEGRLTIEEIEKTYTIASVRIHVERSIQRIKTYNIFQKIPSNLFSHIDDILYVCCALTNLQPPTIAVPT